MTYPASVRMSRLAGGVAASIAMAMIAVTAPSAHADRSRAASVESTSAALAPRVYGGVPASGSPLAVALALNEGGQWAGECTGALWKPRIIVTAAHCVTASGSGANITGIAVFPPGARALIYSNLGPQGASPAQVVSVLKASDYVEANTTVDPNDIALLVLDRDLAPSAYTRLATGTELRRWVAQQALVDHVGYGLTGPNQPAFDPYAVSLPLTSFTANSRLGPVFGTAQSNEQGVCPGDSGSPASRSEGGAVLLLGPMAGGNGPCSGITTPSNVGFAAMGYIPMLNQALTAVGMPTIPSPPTKVTVTGRNRDAVVAWTAPEISPETAVAYDVTNSQGTVVCQSVSSPCVVPSLPDGAQQFWVRARNAQGEGGSSVEPGSVTIAPPTQLPPPRIGTEAGKRVIRFTGLGTRSSAVVTAYVVRTTQGKVLCKGAPTDPAMTDFTCTTLPKAKGTYRVVVRAITEMGRTPWSAPSTPFRVR